MSKKLDKKSIIEIVKSLAPVVVTGAFLMIALIYFIVSPLSTAWFAMNTNTSASGSQVSSGMHPFPSVNMWTYVTEKEKDGGSSGWQVCDVQNDISVSTVGGMNQKKDGAFVMKSLALGSIDNLIRTSDDNVTYVVFEIKPEKAGEIFSIDVAMPEKDGTTYPFEIYDANGEYVDPAVTETPYANMYDSLVSEDKQMLLKVSYFVSKTEYSSPDDFDESVEFTEYVDEVNETNSYTADSEDAYFLYVKMYPSSEMFTALIKDLYRYMPCILLYNLEIEYDFAE